MSEIATRIRDKHDSFDFFSRIIMIENSKVKNKSISEMYLFYKSTMTNSLHILASGKGL